MPPITESLYYSIKFLVVGGVFCLELNFSLKNSNRMALLAKHATYTNMLGIACHFKDFRKIW